MEFGLFGGAKRAEGDHSGDSQSYSKYVDYVIEVLEKTLT